MVEKNKGCGGPFHLILVFYKVDTLSLWKGKPRRRVCKSLTKAT